MRSAEHGIPIPIPTLHTCMIGIGLVRVPNLYFGSIQYIQYSWGTWLVLDSIIGWCWRQKSSQKNARVAPTLFPTKADLSKAPCARGDHCLSFLAGPTIVPKPKVERLLSGTLGIVSSLLLLDLLCFAWFSTLQMHFKACIECSKWIQLKSINKIQYNTKFSLWHFYANSCVGVNRAMWHSFEESWQL